MDRALELGGERLSADDCTISYVVLRRATLADPEAVRALGGRARTEAKPGRPEGTGDRQVNGGHS